MSNITAIGDVVLDDGALEQAHCGCTVGALRVHLTGALNRCTERVHCGCTELFSTMVCRNRCTTGALRVH